MVIKGDKRSFIANPFDDDHKVLDSSTFELEIWNDGVDKTILLFKFSTIHTIIYWKAMLKIKKSKIKLFSN
jgi:hypothetical protein